MKEEPAELPPIVEALSAAVQRAGLTLAEAVGSVDLDADRGSVEIWLRGGPPGLGPAIERSLARLPGVHSVRVTHGGGERER